MKIPCMSFNKFLKLFSIFCYIQMFQYACCQFTCRRECSDFLENCILSYSAYLEMVYLLDLKHSQFRWDWFLPKAFIFLDFAVVAKVLTFPTQIIALTSIGYDTLSGSMVK